MTVDVALSQDVGNGGASSSGHSPYSGAYQPLQDPDYIDFNGHSQSPTPDHDREGEGEEGGVSESDEASEDDGAGTGVYGR